MNVLGFISTGVNETPFAYNIFGSYIFKSSVTGITPLIVDNSDNDIFNYKFIIFLSGVPAEFGINGKIQDHSDYKEKIELFTQCFNFLRTNIITANETMKLRTPPDLKNETQQKEQ